MCTLSRPAAAARWTSITVLNGDYPDMKTRMTETGSDADVNSIVLHSVEGKSLSAYRLLPDERADQHEPGQCCPNDDGPCCGVEDIPLDSIGLGGTTFFTYENLGAAFAKIQEKWPADRYFISLRGHIGKFTYTLLTPDRGKGDGVTIAQVSDILQKFVERNGGKKIDALNIGLCLGASADWAFAVAPYVNFYIASPNWSNEPVAQRWRTYRWVRELIERKTITGKGLSSKIVFIYTTTTKYCEGTGHGCSNLDIGEPWTATSFNLYHMPAFTSATKDLVCALADKFDADAFNRALERTTQYGTGDTRRPNSQRNDIRHFAMNLKEEMKDPAVQKALDDWMAFLDPQKPKLVYRYAFEEGAYENQAYGMSGFFVPNYATPAEIGNFQMDSMWSILMGKLGGSKNGIPAATGVSIDAPYMEVMPGKTIPLTARGMTQAFGSMCPLTGIKWSIDGAGVGTIADPAANPATFQASKVGQTKVTVTHNGKTANVMLYVKDIASDPTLNPDGTSDEDGAGAVIQAGKVEGGDEEGKGCGCRVGGSQSTGPASALAALLGLGLSLRLARRRRDTTRN